MRAGIMRWIGKGKGGHTAAALTKVEHVTDGDGHGSKEALVAALGLVLI
jgi:hypothetical protein